MEDRKRTGSKSKMLLKMVLSSLIRRKSRMVVALLAVAIGGTILSGLMTIYYDIPRQMGKEFRSYGANMILLPQDEVRGLTLDDINPLKEVVSGFDLEGMTPFGYDNSKINEQPVVIAGTDFDEVAKTRPFWHIDGEFPKNDTEALAGSEVAQLLYLKPGKVVNIEYKQEDGSYESYKVTISGIVQSGKSEDGMLFLELPKFIEITGTKNAIDVIELSLSAKKEELAGVQADYDKTQIVKSKLVKKVANSEDTVLSKLQALVWLVSIIVLILTMISVGTTMMAAVMERREEIGLKKALGAPNKSITLEFLFEGLLLGALGGALGMILGFLFAQSVSMKVFGRGIVIQPTIAIITVIMSVIITGIASLIPVRRATEIDPALVLKGE